MWAGTLAASGGSTPPDNPPTPLGLDFVPGTSRVRVNWTDPVGTFAHVQVGVNIEGNTGPTAIEPDFVLAVIGPGVQVYNSLRTAASLNYLRDGTPLTDWWIRSENDGLVSSWQYCGNSQGGAG